jgi:hypothetical protein
MRTYKSQLTALIDGICLAYGIETTVRPACKNYVLTQIENLPAELRVTFHLFSVFLISGIFFLKFSLPGSMTDEALVQLVEKLREFPLKPVREYIYFLSQLCILKGFDHAI